MKSIWQTESESVSFPALEGDARTDILIIGGGIAGILCAYKLRCAGVDCMLAEAAEILGGVSGYTTAKLTFSHGLIYDSLINRFGERRAGLYLRAQQDALGEYSRLAKEIDCDYEEKTSYVYSLRGRKRIENEVYALRSLGVRAELSEACGVPFKTDGAVRVENQAQINPLKFLRSIAKDMPIFENTKVTELGEHKAKTTRGEITFKKAVIATHFPVLNKHGLYFLKLYQHRSYVLALKGAPDPRGMYVDESGIGLSFRTCGDILLLGGGGHRTGKRGGGFAELEAVRAKYYKNAKTVGKWATQDCMSLDTVPYIGQYSPSTPDLYVATGFNKWGMTNALVSANILTDLIKGKKSPYSEIFTPSRPILRPGLFKNAFESAVGLITPTAPRCPHLGCALKYNREEHSWDCPCHGSRFTETGKLINNPATDDKKFKQR